MVGDALTRNEGTEATTGPARLRRRGLAVLCLVTLALLAGGAQAASGNLDLVSRASGASGAKGNGLSKVIGISGDGRFVAFSSLATNLSPDDGDATYDSYVRDLQTGTTTLVCRASGADGAKGNGASADGAVSADGRFVAFESGATNLDPDDGDAIFDAYVRDLQTNTTTLVSRASGASGPKGNADSIVFANAISSDGRFVAFASRATNLSPDDGDAITDVFRRDLANSQPVAAADAYTAEANTPLTVAAPGVLANDSDPDGDPLSARPVSGPEHGTLALNADGSFVHARGRLLRPGLLQLQGERRRPRLERRHGGAHGQRASAAASTASSTASSSPAAAARTEAALPGTPGDDRRHPRQRRPLRDEASRRDRRPGRERPGQERRRRRPRLRRRGERPGRGRGGQRPPLRPGRYRPLAGRTGQGPPRRRPRRRHAARWARQGPAGRRAGP
jgi:hypothetical protein